MVLNNRDLNQVTWEQRVQLGDPARRNATQSIPISPTTSYAELLGLKGIFVDDPETARRGVGRGAGGRIGRWS